MSNPTQLSDKDYDEISEYQFYSCYRCKKLITWLELQRACTGEKATGCACPCGSTRVQPANVEFRQYVQENVIEMARHLGADIEDYISEAASVLTDKDVEDIRFIWSRLEEGDV